MTDDGQNRQNQDRTIGRPGDPAGLRAAPASKEDDATTLEKRLSDTVDAVGHLPPDAVRIAEALNQHSIVSITDPDGVILAVNDAFCALSGYERKELLGQRHGMLRSDRHTDQFFRRMWESIGAGEVWQGVLCNRSKGGELYWLQTTITPVPGSGGKPEYHIGIHTDVTSMKRSEQDHQRNTWLLMLLHGHTSSLLEATPAEQRKRIKLVITELGDAMAADLGMLLSADSSDGNARVEHQTPEVQRALQRDLESLGDEEVLRDLVAADGPRIGPLRSDVPGNGIERVFLEHGWKVVVALPVGENRERHDTIIFAWRDASASNWVREHVYLFNLLCDLVATAQQRLRTEAWLKTHTEVQDARQYLAQLGDWDMDVASLQVSWTPELFGVDKSRTRLELAAFIELVHPDDRRRFFKELNNCINHHVPASFEFRIGDGAADATWVLMRGARMRNRSRGTDTLVATLIDVTEHKQTELALKHATAQAELANRTKSQFLSNMSHELRTPLNSILGFGQLLEIDEALGPDQKDSVGEIIRSGEHLLELINEVLDLSLIESGRPNIVLERVRVAEVIDESLAMVRELARRQGIRLDVDSLSAAAIFVDRMRFKQALINLLSNAVKYNKPGGEVRVRTASTGEGRLTISVEDTGLGIDTARQQDIFKPFERLGRERTSTEGTGIGLAFTKSVVELMGGEIDFRSSPGDGTTFYLTFALPASEPRVMLKEASTVADDLPESPAPAIGEDGIAVIGRGQEGADMLRAAIGESAAAEIATFEPDYPFEKLRHRVGAQIVVVHVELREDGRFDTALLQHIESVFRDPWMIALLRAEDLLAFSPLAPHFDFICLLPIDVAKLRQTVQLTRRQIALARQPDAPT